MQGYTNFYPKLFFNYHLLVVALIILQKYFSSPLQMSLSVYVLACNNTF